MGSSNNFLRALGQYSAIAIKPTLEKKLFWLSYTRTYPYALSLSCTSAISKVRIGIQKTKKNKRLRVGSNHQPFGIMNKNNSRTRKPIAPRRRIQLKTVGTLQRNHLSRLILFPSAKKDPDVGTDGLLGVLPPGGEYSL